MTLISIIGLGLSLLVGLIALLRQVLPNTSQDLAAKNAALTTTTTALEKSNEVAEPSAADTVTRLQSDTF